MHNSTFDVALKASVEKCMTVMHNGTLDISSPSSAGFCMHADA